MFRFYWITGLIISSVIGAFCSKQYNDTHRAMWSWFIILNGLAGICLWSFISKLSDNLILDNILFDTALSTTYVIVFIYLGCGETFSVLNWIGVLIVLTGIVLMKV